MDPNQQQLLLTGGAKDSTYVDDVFNVEAYKGTAQNGQQHVNGIDLAGEGGMLWVKDRTAANNHVLFDTERGPTVMLRLGNTTAGEEGIGSGVFESFNSDGWTSGNWGGIGHLNNYGAWTFRNQDGFFKVVKWTGNGVSGRQIAHGLESTPGFVMTKALDNSDGWRTLHRWDFSKMVYISNDLLAGGSSSAFTGSVCDATHLTVTSDGAINASGQDYIAYVFAGGPSTAAGANSISFPSPAGDPRRILCGNASNTTADFNFGTGDLTIECWIKCNASQGSYPRVVAIGPQWQAEMAALQWDHSENANKVTFYCYNHSSSTTSPLLTSTVKGFNGDGQWHHIAVSRSGNTWRLFVDGNIEDKETWTGSTNTANSYCTIGNTPGTATTAWFGGYISNVRVVKGTAVYTSAFRPPTAPLTNITNTKLLCCNNLSATSATVTPIALTETNVSQNQTENPFDDPEGFKFGGDGDENLIKCGSYTGNTSVQPIINCGWEPQFIMIKCTSQGTTNWSMYDCIRGIFTGESENYLYPNLSSTEYTADRLELTSTGFKVITTGGVLTNVDGGNYIYIAIRRSDGYVGKPALAGTDALAMDTGAASSNIPNFDSSNNFPVDFCLVKTPASSGDTLLGARLIANRYLVTNDSNAQASATASYWRFDSNKGWNAYNGYNSTYQSWMLKRGAGFDVVTYKGTGTSPRTIPHSLGRTPEMIWVKNRDNGNEWIVGHKGLSGAANIPWHYSMHLQNSDAEVDTAWTWADTPPTSTHFTLHSDGYVNGNTQNYIAMLFASVDGISKLGSYTGTDSNPGPTITTGFQPRFIMIKARNQSGNWVYLDSLRGITGGNDYYMWLNRTQAQENALDILDVSSTGFTIKAAYTDTNVYQYIYYAHA